MSHDRLRLRVQRITLEAEGVRAYELVHPEGQPLPAFEAGSHLNLQVPGGAWRTYSLCNDPAETHRYLIAVQREAQGRGGSRALHDGVHEGDVLAADPPRCDFPLLYARGYVLVAGGIGLTPLVSMAHVLRRQDVPWHLHVCTRSPERTAFRELLTSPAFAGHVTLHHDGGDPTRALDMKTLLASRAPGTRLYCCGPASLMQAVRTASTHHAWPREKVHFEAFSAEGTQAVGAQADSEFQVVVRSTGAQYPVPPGQSVLQVLRDQGLRVPSQCEAGTCGACVTGVLEGDPEHRDTFLPEAQRTARRSLLVCVSRARSRTLVLDL